MTVKSIRMGTGVIIIIKQKKRIKSKVDKVIDRFSSRDEKKAYEDAVRLYRTARNTEDEVDARSYMLQKKEAYEKVKDRVALDIIQKYANQILRDIRNVRDMRNNTNSISESESLSPSEILKKTNSERNAYLYAVDNYAAMKGTESENDAYYLMLDAAQDYADALGKAGVSFDKIKDYVEYYG